MVHNQHVGDPVTGAERHLEDDPGSVSRRVGRVRWNRMDLAGEEIDLGLHLVKARSQQPVDSDYTASLRGKRQGLEQRGPTWLALMRWQTSQDRA